VSNALGAAGELAIRSLVERAPLASSLAQAFKAKGFTLALVGGPVRDAILGRLGNDLDFTTNARPNESKKILQTWAENIWETGIEFGTVAGKRGDTTVEVTTYRSETYNPDSRNPEVKYGDSIDGDLQDFPLFPDESAVIGSSRHILYVEDDKWYARDRILQLEESGYTVKYVRTAKLAVSAWNRVNFDVVILDIRMPHPINISGIDPGDSTGVWVLEQIAKKVIDSRAVIWILTNRTDLNTVIDELESRVPELIGRFHVDPKNDIELRYFSATLGEILRRSFD